MSAKLEALRAKAIEASRQFISAINKAKLPRDRDSEEQNYLDEFECEARMAWREYRQCEFNDRWERHEKGAEETRETYPWLRKADV